MKRFGTLLVLLAAGMFTLSAVGCGDKTKTKSPSPKTDATTKTEATTKTTE